jgi:hypothetical protein
LVEPNEETTFDCARPEVRDEGDRPSGLDVAVVCVEVSNAVPLGVAFNASRSDLRGVEGSLSRPGKKKGRLWLIRFWRHEKRHPSAGREPCLA